VDFERVAVTGVAGFVGSHLAERLLGDGVQVVGIDCVTDYYDPSIKRAHLAELARHADFEHREIDLATDEIAPHLDGIGTVFHQAATPGVRASWADGFLASVTNNVTATQRLLEAARQVGVERFVYASSSSVYGEAAEIPMREDGPLRPYSPYGVTKLSAEQLCTVYASNFDVPTVSLRYFTVYGPRQRPDMATHRLIQAALNSTPFPLYGALGHVRDFTYVDDIVEANLAAATRDIDPGTIVNVAGGSVVSIAELIDGVEEVTGRTLVLDDQGRKAGDVTRTEADLTRARDVLGWRSKTSLLDGLAAQAEWHRKHAALLADHAG
jgi:UDP-glucuronate 4-epimerase